MAGQVPFKKGQDIKVTIKVLEVYKTAEEAQAVANKDRVAGAADRERQMLEQMRKDTAFQSSIGRDSRLIEAHLASKGVSASKTDMGVYVQMIQAGQGAKPAAGQYANIKYRGTDLNGKKFDEGTYPMQIGMGGSIPGFENGVKQFSKGGKGVIYVPSILGYGPQGQPPVIQPNQILVFEIELLDISDRPIQPSAAPAPQGHSKDDGHGH
jgi:FKBP-type peptidyl-prolyl cis-trans isomerase